MGAGIALTWVYADKWGSFEFSGNAQNFYVRFFMSGKQYQIDNFGWNPWTIMEVLNLDFHIKHEFSAFLKEKLFYEVNFLGADYLEFVP